VLFRSVKLQESGARLATIPVGQGPAALALDVPRSRLYVLNRFDGTVSAIDTATDTELGRVAFYDPTPQIVKDGRPFLYDAHRSSVLGNVSCAGCHVDATMDTEAWDLGDPAGAMKTLDEPCNQGLSVSGTCSDWHPMKGPMMTQSLIGSVGTEPLHWRGDRENMTAFKAGFIGLLGVATPPSDAEMAKLEAFLGTIRFQPNPYRTWDDGLPTSIPGFAGDPQTGEMLFMTANLDAAGGTCVGCHSGPTGARGTLVSANVIQETQSLNVPQLSGIYKKRGLDFASTTNDRGFGFAHDGSADTIFDFLGRSEFTFAPGAAGDQQRRDLEAFVMAFPTDTHPAVGMQLTVDGTNDDAAGTVTWLANATGLADAGAVGVVAKGRSAGLARGWAYRPGTGTFQSDRATDVPTTTVVRRLGAAGSEVTFTVVPVATATRIGIDRDGDGFFDRDELDAGSDPADPQSVPASNPGDTDGDGVPDASDDCPTVADPAQSDADGDGLGDACDPCTGGSVLQSAKLKLARLGTPAGDEIVKVAGTLVVPATPALAPSTTGVRVLLVDGGGAGLLDLTIPGGAHWTSRGSTWTYRDAAGAAITKVKVRKKAGTSGKTTVNVVAKPVTVASPGAAAPPAVATVVLDPPNATTGLCATSAFGRCWSVKGGSAFKCR